MTRLRRISGKELVRALERVGFEQVRKRGSHVILKHFDGRQTVIPVHSGEVLGPGLIRAILRDVKMRAADLGLA